VLDSQEAPALKDVFKDAFLMGSSVNTRVVSGADAASQALVLRHFSTITAENVLRAGAVNPRRFRSAA
jgi:endo-1,4-beta-xylanase